METTTDEEIADPPPGIKPILGKGVLRQVIKAAQSEARRCRPIRPHTLDALSVLTDDPFRQDTPINHVDGKWFGEMVERFMPGNSIIHLRGLHYKIISAEDVPYPKGRGLAPQKPAAGKKKGKKPSTNPYYENSLEDWAYLQDEGAKAGRWLGYVPFWRIKDERNAPPDFEHVPKAEPWSPLELIIRDGDEADCPDTDRLMPDLSWQGGCKPRQPYRIALIGEKSSLRDVLLPIALRHEAELLLPSGEISDSMLYGLVKRAAGARS